MPIATISIPCSRAASRLFDRTLGRVGIAVGQDHDVPLAVAGDQLPACHLQGVGQVGAPLRLETVHRRVQPAHVARRRRLQRDQGRERDQADFHRREVALRQKLARGRLGLDQGLAGHARRHVDQQKHADQLGLAGRRASLGRAAQPREIVGDGLDRHRQPVAGVALNGLHLDDAVGVVRQADVDRHLGIGRVNVFKDVLAQDRAIERGGAFALRQINLQPRVGAAVGFMKV